MDCVFCNIKDIVVENDLAVAFYDKYPVNKGHLLFISKRHVEQYFDLTDQEKRAIDQLVLAGKKILDEQFQPDGYNIGINCGEAAGQTIFHVHVHLIPRYKGDMEDPRGGIRGVIPNKRMYEQRSF
ncbi:HIT family protein [Bacillus sp. EB600]|uniref:HIT family protein n=1 Tax=Bacillus sp. EB600 TaxID=2806345 RepID=UPI00210ECD47|nr:HIT family protein [Bacillus sp. EB600]MCQ6281617.1 HIT family protein [Bacillus sp. EB600]